MTLLVGYAGSLALASRPEEATATQDCLSVPSGLRPATDPAPHLHDAQLDRVSAAFLADWPVYVFAAPFLTFAVTEDALPQARATPQTGVIHVSSGLLSLRLSDDELYAVLSHEAFHVALRHGSTACGEAGAAEQQAQELAADAQAVDLLAQVGRDPGALSAVLGRLASLDRSPQQRLSTHPRWEARLEQLRERRVVLSSLRAVEPARP